jgi:hypothetical protein
MQYVTDNLIFQWLLTVVSYAVAEPNMRAIMQNLTATSLWEIGRVVGRLFQFRKGFDSNATRGERPQLIESTGDLQTVMIAAIKSLRNRSGELTIKTQSSKYKKTELTIKLGWKESSDVNSNAGREPDNAPRASVKPEPRTFRLNSGAH